MRFIHQLLWRCLNSLHVAYVWDVWTLNPLDRLTLLGRWKYCMCSFIGSALFYDADSRLPRLSGLDFVLSHQFGIRRTGPQSGSVLTSAGRRRLWQFAAGPPLRGRRDALWEDLGLHADSEPAPHRRDGPDVAETTHGRERLPVISSGRACTNPSHYLRNSSLF